jgi:HD-GYP domain-containing protein (c-di-GMP phosphodiesterase class II)
MDCDPADMHGRPAQALDRTVSDERPGLACHTLLHDIGKIGFSDAILLKPGPLDEHESAVLRTHSKIGYAILRMTAASAGTRQDCDGRRGQRY